MGNSFFGAIVMMFSLLIIDIVSIMEGIAWLAISVSGPLVLWAYMIFLTKSPKTDFDAFKGSNLLVSIGASVFMFFSVGGIALYVFKNSKIFWS